MQTREIKTTKHLTDFKFHEEILTAIKENNAIRLLTYLPAQEEWREALDAVDEGGKSLLTLIRESSIDVNKKYPYRYAYDDNKYFMTPLQVLLNLLFGNRRPCKYHFDAIELNIILGFDINFPVYDDGDTVLHFCAKNPAQVFLIRFLVEKGADLYKKNNKGQTPFDLIDPAVVRYLENISLIKDEKYVAASIIKRSFRLWRTKKMEPSYSYSVTLFHPAFPETPALPEANPPDAERMKAWVNRHAEKDRETAQKIANSIQYISFERFLLGLKIAVNQFNRYLMSLPESQRNYVLLMDDCKDNSSPWVSKLAEKYLLIAPKKIMQPKDLEIFDPLNEIHHFVFLDDAVYSGNQQIKRLENDLRRVESNNKLVNMQSHLIIPFASEHALTRFQEYDVIIHTHKKLASFTVPGTSFIGQTAAYFDHKIPVKLSTIVQDITEGKLITGEKCGICFVEPKTPPYKRQSLTNG